MEQYYDAKKQSFEDFEKRRAENQNQETSGNIVCDYRANIANHLAHEVYKELGCRHIEPAFEISCMNGNELNDAELMRCKYCLRYELGSCIKGKDNGVSDKERLHIPPQTKLFLENEGRLFALHFDCVNCEMVIRKHTGNQL